MSTKHNAKRHRESTIPLVRVCLDPQIAMGLKLRKSVLDIDLTLGSNSALLGATDARATRRQAELLAQYGGRDKALARGDLGLTPAPGTAAEIN